MPVKAVKLVILNEKILGIQVRLVTQAWALLGTHLVGIKPSSAIIKSRLVKKIGVFSGRFSSNLGVVWDVNYQLFPDFRL